MTTDVATASSPGPSAGAAFRRLYARAANPEALIRDGGLIEAIGAEVRQSGPGAGQPLDRLIGAAADWSSAAAQRFRAVGDPTDR
ncbi:MAG: hypothetical protein ACM30G_01985, partial [Micromonosporaceae bacterium]